MDPSGPLATLRKILLSEESIASLQRFLTQHWYTIIFLVAGVLLLMVRIDRRGYLQRIFDYFYHLRYLIFLNSKFIIFF